nr:uncharacterized protein LOC106687014 isoform X2 [Halyomorpha halys]
MDTEVFYLLGLRSVYLETLRKMKTAQLLMDDFLKNERSLQSFSTFEEPIMLEQLSYNEDEVDISFSNLEMAVENATIRANAEHPLQTLNIELSVGKVYISGMSTVKSGSIRHQSDFRFTVQSVECAGTGGIVASADDLDCEWVLMNCSEEKFMPIDIVLPSSLKESGLHKKRHFNNSEAGLLRSIETNLNALCALRLKNALQRLPPSLKNLLNNMANTKMAKLEEFDSNEFMDSAISVITYYIKQRYNDSIHLPDLREAIPCSLLSLLRCDTGLIARNGSAKDVSTLQRIGNARITRRNLTVDFTGNVKFEKLYIYYEKYKASLLGIGPTGNLKLRSQQVIIGMQLEINFGNRMIGLKKLKLQKLGVTQVELSGLGIILGRVLTTISPYFVGIFNAQVSRIVEQRVSVYAREALKKNTIDDIFRGNITL